MTKITTERLILREINRKDTQEIFAIRKNESVNTFINRIPPVSLKEVDIFIDNILNLLKRKKTYFWVICFKDSPKILGTICLWKISEDRKNAELGYELLPDYQKIGIMNEAVKGILEFGFEVEKFEKISAFTHKDNSASIHLLEKNGFILSEGEKDENNMNNLIFRKTL